MIIAPSHRIGKVETYYFATKLAEIAEMNAQGADIINLGIGSPDMLPPVPVMDALREASHQSTANKYQSYKGIPELRVAFAKWYDRYFKVELDSTKEVLPLIGSKEGIMHVAMSFLQEGDQALVPNPGYPAYTMTTKLAGAEPVFYNLTAENNWLPDLDALSKQDLSRVKIMWLNYPNMPTGASADRHVFEQLVAFAKEHEILLVHDNPYAFILNNAPLSLLSIEGSRKVALELNSLSKCYNMAGWRVGVLAGAKPYIDTVMKFKSNMDSGMYRPIQKAAIKALETGEEWFDKNNEIYNIRREKVWEIMDYLDCKYDKTATGLFVWGRIPDDVDKVDEMVDAILYDKKVFLTPGFIFGSNGARYIRISLCMEVDTIEQALQRIKK